MILLFEIFPVNVEWLLKEKGKYLPLTMDFNINIFVRINYRDSRFCDESFPDWVSHCNANPMSGCSAERSITTTHIQTRISEHPAKYDLIMNKIFAHSGESLLKLS